MALSQFYNRTSNAVLAALDAFKLAYSSPGAAGQATKGFTNQSTYYDLLWNYYNNRVFDMAETSWQQYRTRYKLYRNTRSIKNPVKRIVNFYAGQVYPGALSEDGSELPEGVALAIPFSKDTPKNLKRAVSQIWQWSNWQSNKAVYVRWCAALGDVMTEVVDDTARGKIYYEHVWPGFVVDLDLDPTGNVLAYTLEYKAKSSNGEIYTFTKVINKYEFAWYRNGYAFDYTGNGALQPNPYGFVPAAWTKHNDIGGVHGQCAFDGSLSKINELNSLASHLLDYAGKYAASPIGITSAASLKTILSDPSNPTSGQANPKRGNTDDFTDPSGDRENQLILRLPQGSDVKPLMNALNIADAIDLMESLETEIANDNPEVTFYERMRDMSQATGPAIDRLSGDVKSRLFEAVGQYDQQSIKLFQMATAIAGMRLAEGQDGWANPTDQQKKFRSFNLESYERGKLDMAIMPRPLIDLSKLERSQERQAKWQAIKIEVDAGIPLEYILTKEEGFTEIDMAEIAALKQEKLAEQQKIFQQQAEANPAQQFATQQKPAQLPPPGQASQSSDNEGSK